MTALAAGVSIRAAVPGDAGRIAVIADELRHYLGDPLGNLTAERILEDGFGDTPEFEVLVAERDGNVVAYALFLHAYEPAYAARGFYLADLCVTASERGCGIGRGLLEAVSRVAGERGRTFVWWLCNPKNQHALDFYRKLAPDIIMPSVVHVRVLTA